MRGICRLCGANADLVRSHIIPKFVFSWIKETSATGKLRPGDNPNKRIQDGPSFPLYCRKCEESFSTYENYFARNIFYPHMEGKFKEIVCSDELERFMVGLFWRILDYCSSDFVKLKPGCSIPHSNAHREWRDYLLGKTSTHKSELHLSLLTDGTFTSIDESKLLWYFHRGTDAEIYSSGPGEIIIYCKMPKMILFSSIFPSRPGDFLGTRVSKGSVIEKESAIFNSGFVRFIRSRVDIINQGEASAERKKVVLKSIRADPKRFRKSETMKYLSKEFERHARGDKTHRPRRKQSKQE